MVKYAKIGGGAQAVAGFAVINSRKFLKSKAVQSMGVILVAHGANNFYESISPILYENQDIGWVREGYRHVSHALGYGNDVADVAYSSVDLAASAYGTYGMFKLKPGAGKLFRYINSDFTRKWRLTPSPILTIQISGSMYKVKLLVEDIYKLYDD
ncbi:DUF4225 domain-containing protein [Photorhabdus sp. APURE]|uniref:DUF4225 domain-containing protein n=1 Tax=Photorhabdus aballayi TaxID=2991723 RepID=UPI00223CE87A|nr:DUF4225 domain-containing protein [Photorhabdus aballayi]MCW7549788.1 DUF4225 domain-containing protein [Photorhabdus aballayi]